MEIKDVIHLYIGCECEFDNVGIATVAGIDRAGNVLLEHYREGLQKVAPPSLVTLKLRPLSDMTEEEFREFVLISNPEQNFIEEHTKEAMDSIRQEGIKAFSFDDILAAKVFELTRFLLSKHFDLFGLIDSGLALDKTKQQ